MYRPRPIRIALSAFAPLSLQLVANPKCLPPNFLAIHGILQNLIKCGPQGHFGATSLELRSGLQTRHGQIYFEKQSSVCEKSGERAG